MENIKAANLTAARIFFLTVCSRGNFEGGGFVVPQVTFFDGGIAIRWTLQHDLVPTKCPSL